MAVEVGLVIDGLSGVLLTALAIAVIRIRPRNAISVALAVMTAGMGVSFALLNAAIYAQAFLVQSFYAAAFLLFAATLALLYLAFAFPRRASARELRLAIAPALIGIAFALAVLIGSDLGSRPDRLGVPAEAAGPFRAAFALFALFAAAGTAVGFFLPLRFREASDDDALSRRRFALLAAALAIFVGSQAGEALLDPTSPPAMRVGLVAFLVGGPALLWLVNTATRPDSRYARNVSLVILASALAGMTSVAVAGGWEASQNSGSNGLFRTAMVLAFVYAILRGQLLDVDTKLHWTIRRGSLAAIFLAVFFVTAQIAQNALSAAYGILAGGIVAGLLLFAIAPLQRLAERVADGAVPLPPSDSASRAYTLALRAALSDGAITPQEEQHLADLAQELGVGAGDALRMRRELEGIGRA